ncbi:hypothetical protein [Streptomyces ficellus]|uniref:hypothetical protein n=1 Tax=Streptomyces ficellus TaxID=1977088 RepID=UPI001AD64087|nr:hypothetical protein [Streptomyces ficellus]
MRTEAPRRINVRNVAHTGAAVAAALLPLTAAVLLARATAGDPLAPVNTLMTSGGQRVRVCASGWRGCGRNAVATCRSELRTGRLAGLASYVRDGRASRGGRAQTGVPGPDRDESPAR